jgi:putative transport protein
VGAADGSSGGALIAGLFLGYLRTRNPAFGQFPAAANWLTQFRSRYP